MLAWTIYLSFAGALLQALLPKGRNGLSRWLALVVFLAGPLLALIEMAFETADGDFAGLGNFIAYARTPALANSLASRSSRPVSCSFAPYSNHFLRAQRRRTTPPKMTRAAARAAGSLRIILIMTG